MTERKKLNTSLIRNERGSVLYLVAGSLVVLLGVAAFAIDLGILFTARSEAQRAAEAGAHAGAGVFLYAPGDEAAAREQAREYAERNMVRWDDVEVRDEDIDVELDQQLVRVRVHRTEARGNPVSTFFARVLGITSSDIGAVAAAQVWPAGAVECLLPIAMPDRWSEGPYPDYGNWPDFEDHFEPEEGNFYEPYDPSSPTSPYTGYSDDDWGYEIRIYHADPNEAPQPGWWYPFRLEGGQGANEMREAIRGCVDESRYQFGDDLEVDTEPGAMAGPVRQGFEDLIDQDPDAYWDTNLNNRQGCVSRDGRTCVSDSPRIRPLAMFDPRDYPDLGMKPFNITNFVGVFVEDVVQAGGGVEVQVRFLRYTGFEPAEEWTDDDTFLRILRIVE